MKINSIKINGFGNLKEKNIELQNGINIVTGKNESGKSTMLKFIPAMFYGLSKLKNKKEIPDLEKYKPWNDSEYSGKILYTLDNGEKIEVFRDFNKKTCKIYNEKGEEITNNYNIDSKTKQNLFFIEQTGITEDILMKTAITEQTETRLDKDSQNAIIQKISNVLSTGQDNISYQKAVNKLKEKQVEEVGTERTVGKPINVVKNELKKYLEKEMDIKLEIKKVENYETEKNNINEEIKETEKELAILNEIKNIQENEYLEEEKINIKKNSLNEYKEKIEELENKEKEIEKNIKIKKENKFIIIFIILLIAGIISFFVTQKIFIYIPIFIISLIFLFKKINKNIKNKKIKEEKENKILNIKKEKEMLEKSLKEKEEEIEKQEKIKNQEKEEKNNNIKYKYNNTDNIEKFLEYNLEKIKIEIINVTNKINNLKIKLNTLQITNKNILEKVEKLPEIEEKILNLKEQEEEIISLNNSINLAKTVLEEAYEKMKENITPEFVINLSKMVKEISEYKNVKFNDIEGLMVELENGEYVKADKLSIGTIDQMYLSLRLSTLKEIIKENIPIILDEPFVYYDKYRLQNILKFLSDNYMNNQIIIFSCSNREVEILDKENIKYNLINI